jgi:hypothetical protein
MVLEKAEVGKKIIGTGADHTPSKIDFEAAIGANPGASAAKRASPAATLVERPRGGTNLQMKPGTSFVPPPPSAAATMIHTPLVSPPQAAPDSGLGGLMKILVGMVAVLVLAIVGMLLFRPKPDNADSPTRKMHEALLQKAREKVKDDPAMARGFLESAREMTMNDSKAKEQESGVAALVEAYELFSQDKDVLDIEKALIRAEKVFPNEPSISRLRGRLDEKQKKPEK